MSEYTVQVRDIDEPRWMEFRFNAPTEYDAKLYALHWFGLATRTFELYAPGHVRIYVFNAD